MAVTLMSLVLPYLYPCSRTSHSRYAGKLWMLQCWMIWQSRSVHSLNSCRYQKPYLLHAVMAVLSRCLCHGTKVPIIRWWMVHVHCMACLKWVRTCRIRMTSVLLSRSLSVNWYLKFMVQISQYPMMDHSLMSVRYLQVKSSVIQPMKSLAEAEKAP